MEIKKSNTTEKYLPYYEIYDKVILKMLPFYIEMHKEIVSLINREKKDKFNICELGFGTGTLTYRALMTFPNANLLGIDTLPENIEKAKEKLQKFKGFNYKKEKIQDLRLDKKYDFFISSLAIHHLSDEEKQQFFKKVYELLNNKGRLITGDLVKSPDEKEWHKYLVNNMGKEGEYRWQVHKQNKEDKPSTIEEQLKWLKEAGFKNVQFTKKWFNFYVFYGEKKL